MEMLLRSLSLIFLIHVANSNCPVHTKTTQGITSVVIGTLENIGINQCQRECKMRMRCNGVTYNETGMSCQFHERTKTGATASIFSWKRDEILPNFDPCAGLACSARSVCVQSSATNNTHCYDDNLSNFIYYNAPFIIRNRGSMVCYTSTGTIPCDKADTNQHFRWLSDTCTTATGICAQLQHINSGLCLLNSNNILSFGTCSTGDINLWSSASSTALHGVLYIMNKHDNSCLYGTGCGNADLCLSTCQPTNDSSLWDSFFI